MSDRMPLDDDEKPPPWYKTYGPPLWRIAFLVVLLVALIVLRKPCSEGVAGFIGNFGPPAADAGARR
jgi:hypothetical protein